MKHYWLLGLCIIVACSNMQSNIKTAKAIFEEKKDLFYSTRLFFADSSNKINTIYLDPIGINFRFSDSLEKKWEQMKFKRSFKNIADVEKYPLHFCSKDKLLAILNFMKDNNINILNGGANYLNVNFSELCCPQIMIIYKEGNIDNVCVTNDVKTVRKKDNNLCLYKLTEHWYIKPDVVDM